MGIKYLNLSSFGQFRQYRTRSLLRSFIIQQLSVSVFFLFHSMVMMYVYYRCGELQLKKVVVQSTAFRVVSMYCSVPLISEHKGTDPHWKHVCCAAAVRDFEKSLITANMQSKTGFPCSHQLKSYVAPKSRLKFAARCPVSSCWPSFKVGVQYTSTPPNEKSLNSHHFARGGNVNISK